MKVRAFTPGDLDAVMRLAAATPEAPRWSRSVYHGFLDANARQKRVLVAEQADAVLGFVAWQIAADVCELESIVVACEHRRKGVGTALLAALTARARECGAVKVQFEVRRGNNAAIRCYEQAGFRREGIRRSYYHDPVEDAILMGLALDPEPEA